MREEQAARNVVSTRTEPQRRQAWFRRRGLGLGVIHALMLGVVVFGCGNALAASTVTRTSSWTYDNNTGLVTSETIEPNSSTAMVKKAYTYDAYGNKTAVTVSGSNIPTRTTSTTYDGQGEFPTKVTNALGQSETWGYDPRFGVPLSHTGPNHLTTTWQYDSLGRKTEEIRPDNTLTYWSYSYSPITSPLGAYYIATFYYKSDFSTQAAPETIDVYDTLGRVVQNFKQGYNASTLSWIELDTQYDAFGRTAKTSLPEFSGDVWTTYSYDVLGRKTQVLNPNGSFTNYEYLGLTTKATVAKSASDPAPQLTTSTNNDLGFPASVTDPTGSTTSYTYDAVGDLIQVKDPANNITNYTFDVRGNKIAMADPDRGQWAYTYDALGELVSQTDANSKTTTFTYDLLGRMLSRVQPDETDTWTYDTAANGIGKLAQASALNTTNNTSNTRSQTYDSFGRPSSTITTPAGSPAYTTTTTYDTTSRISTVAYPSGFVVQYNYSAIGTLSSLTEPAAGQTLWTLNTSNASSQVTQETLGNGVIVNNQYDPNTLRLTATQAQSFAQTDCPLTPNCSVANFTYNYDGLGNLTQRTDANENLTEQFTYDSLDRLLTDNISGGASKSVSYDSLGDIQNKSDVGSYFYEGTYSGSGPATHPHAVAVIESYGTYTVYNVNTVFSYDADGNQLTGEGRTIAWKSYNMVSSITAGTTIISYTYDADHNRISQSAPEGVTQYLNDPTSGVRSERFITASGVTWRDYLFAGGEMLGVHVTPSTGSAYNRYFVRDHLGSVAVLTDDVGNAVERDSYDAWGKRRNPSGADDVNNSITSQTTRGFTGQEEIQDVGLINFNARLYDPLIGRFLSPDTVVQDALNLQDLNPYSYVLNNPLSLTDPTGQSFLGIILGILAIVVAIVLYQPELLEAEFAFTALEAQATAAVIAGAAAGAISSGGTWQGALLGAIEAGAFFGIGQLASFVPQGSLFGLAAGSLAAEATSEQFLFTVAGDGLVGGLANLAQGESFESGFLAAGFSAASGGVIRDLNPDFAEGLVANTVAGGVGSVLGGGKFLNGAETGTFQYLFSGDAARAAENSSPSSWISNVPVLGQIDDALDWLGSQTYQAADWAGNAIQNAYSKVAQISPPFEEFPLDPTAPPGPGYIWRGQPGSTPGDGYGNWYNPDTGESLRPDLNHPDPIGPHWDYRAPDGSWYRWSPDGSMGLKA